MTIPGLPSVARCIAPGTGRTRPSVQPDNGEKELFSPKPLQVSWSRFVLASEGRGGGVIARNLTHIIGAAGITP
jgi:hypothetical protein